MVATRVSTLRVAIQSAIPAIVDDISEKLKQAIKDNIEFGYNILDWEVRSERRQQFYSRHQQISTGLYDPTQSEGHMLDNVEIGGRFEEVVRSLLPLKRTSKDPITLSSQIVKEVSVKGAHGKPKLAQYHEFGVPSINLPARPFVRPAIDVILPQVPNIVKKIIEQQLGGSA
jgi:hypothetical protein